MNRVRFSTYNMLYNEVHFQLENNIKNKAAGMADSWQTLKGSHHISLYSSSQITLPFKTERSICQLCTKGDYSEVYTGHASSLLFS